MAWPVPPTFRLPLPPTSDEDLLRWAKQMQAAIDSLYIQLARGLADVAATTSSNIEGGAAATVYTPDQLADGGTA